MLSAQRPNARLREADRNKAKIACLESFQNARRRNKHAVPGVLPDHALQPPATVVGYCDGLPL